MAVAQNRRRNTRKSGSEQGTLWGSLFRKKDSSEDLITSVFFPNASEDEDEYYEERNYNWVKQLWRRLNVLSVAAIAAFTFFIIMVLNLTMSMWSSQDLSDIAGYQDKRRAKDLTTIIRQANGSEVVITEGDLNRYLRETCRLRQTGAISSVCARVQGIAVRVHNGYAELIIDRLLGANINQTTSVFLSFSLEDENGHPVLHTHFHGGEPIWGTMPCGGLVGSLKIPQRHSELLKPALLTLLDCYPEICMLIEHHNYDITFNKGTNGRESTIRLVPGTANLH